MNGITRRDLLWVGGLSACGAGMLDLMPLQATATVLEESEFGQAKSCILLFLFGSPSQHETFDPKPEAPTDIQGEIEAIETSVKGYRMCERRSAACQGRGPLHHRALPDAPVSAARRPLRIDR